MFLIQDVLQMEAGEWLDTFVYMIVYPEKAKEARTSNKDITIPAFSKDLNACEALIERLGQMHTGYVEMVYTKNAYFNTRYAVRCKTDEFFNFEIDFKGDGETLPLAICRAAIRGLNTVPMP